MDDDARTVDHHVDVAEDRSLAFAWGNLYLACSPCQRRLPETSILRDSCLDPCASAVDPGEHLDFNEERCAHRTQIGDNTIRKYKLNDQSRAYRRLKALQSALVWVAVLEERAKDRPLTDKERRELWRFASEEGEYSLMFRCLLNRAGIPEP